MIDAIVDMPNKEQSARGMTGAFWADCEYTEGQSMSYCQHTPQPSTHGGRNRMRHRPWTTVEYGPRDKGIPFNGPKSISSIGECSAPKTKAIHLMSPSAERDLACERRPDSDSVKVMHNKLNTRLIPNPPARIGWIGDRVPAEPHANHVGGEVTTLPHV